jgi:hypothetical protein
MWGNYQICNWGQGLGLQNATVRATVINSLLCPTDPSPPLDMNNSDEVWGQLAAGSSYVSNIGDNCLCCDANPPRPGVRVQRAYSGYPCRSVSLGDTANPNQFPIPASTGTGIFWRQEWE